MNWKRKPKPVIFVDELAFESLKESFGIVTEKDFIFTIHADFVLEKKKQMKTLNMTRREAIDKCHGIAYPEALIQALEALGLVEFKAENNLALKIIEAMSKSGISGSTVMMELNRAGLKIVPK